MRSTVHGRNGHLQIASVYGIGQEGPELTLCRDIFKLGGDCPGSVVFAYFHGHLFRTVIALFACLAGKSLNMGGFLQINDNPVRRLGVLVAPVGSPESIQIAIQTSLFQPAVPPVSFFRLFGRSAQGLPPVRSSNSILLASIDPLKMK